MDASNKSEAVRMIATTLRAICDVIIERIDQPVTAPVIAELALVCRDYLAAVTVAQNAGLGCEDVARVLTESSRLPAELGFEANAWLEQRLPAARWVMASLENAPVARCTWGVGPCC